MLSGERKKVIKIKITNEIVDRVLLLSEIKQMSTNEIVEATGLSTSSVCTIVRIRKAALHQDYDTLIYLAGTSAASGLMVNCQKSLFHKIELPPEVISRMNASRDFYLLRERERRSRSDEAADCADSSVPVDQNVPPAATDETSTLQMKLLKEMHTTQLLTNGLLMRILNILSSADDNTKKG